jgi:hypothetical protein
MRLAFFGLLLAGCNAPADPVNQADTAAPVQSAQPALEAEGAAPPGAFQWTGRFAASEALCRGGVWEFTNARVETDGETSCAIGDVREGDGGAELSLSCQAEGMTSDERWTLRQQADGMRVTRRTGTDSFAVDLRRCP